MKNPHAANVGGRIAESLNSNIRPSEPPRQPLTERMSAHAIPYLAALLNCTAEEAWTRQVYFQVFDDLPAKDKSKGYHFPGCLEDRVLQLEHLNLDQRGIFITVNETDLLGRSKGNIVAARAVWADIDEEKDTAEKELDLGALALPPSLVVRSGHGWHLYWIFPEAIPCDERKQRELEAMLRGIQIALKPYGADSKVCQIQTVLRLPGFYNVKREPVLVEVVQ